jgi:hypothetical protein
MRYLLAALVAVGALAGAAHAYPQFQIGMDPTCTGCHLSPAGGGLLNENGLGVASTLGQFGGAPEAAHGALVGPDWLTVGGDARFAAGVVEQHKLNPAAFPMQLEVAANAKLPAGFAVYATVGGARGDGNRPITFLLLREHYVQWQADEGSNYGLFLRAGRFMPVYGLRLAEHDEYTRRYGQTPLYGETYGVAAEYIEPTWEVHATGFVHDPLQDPIERGNGGALDGEVRLGQLQLGLQGRYAKSADEARTAGGATVKWKASPGLLFAAESSVIHQTFAAGGARNQIASELFTSIFFNEHWFVDVGLGQFDEDLKAPKVDLEGLDVNLHWFASSHLELLFTNRVQTIDLTKGGRSSGWSLIQVHYRL